MPTTAESAPIAYFVGLLIILPVSFAVAAAATEHTAAHGDRLAASHVVRRADARVVTGGGYHYVSEATHVCTVRHRNGGPHGECSASISPSSTDVDRAVRRR